MPLLVLPFLAPNPVLWHVWRFDLRWYALAYIAGLVIGWLYARALVARASLWPVQPGDPALLDDLLVWVALGVILGGRLVYVVFYYPGKYLADPVEVLRLWNGGMAFHGGLFGATLAIVLFARHHRLPVLSYLDAIAAVAPIGLFFGRIANYINGELWGRVTDVPWAMVFPKGGPLPRHPSQLYEAALEGVLLFVIVTAMVRSGATRRPGLVAGTFAALYGVVRILGETVREPDGQLGFLFGPVTMGMLLSLPLIVAGLWAVVHALRAPAGMPAPAVTQAPDTAGSTPTPSAP